MKPTDYTILDVKWRSARDTLGFVAIKSHNGWKAYMGPGKAHYDIQMDIDYIAAYGVKMTQDEAKVFFPQFNIDEYIK